MTDNIVNLPAEPIEELLVGPFKNYRVQVEGRIIPRLTGYREKMNGVDGVFLVVDGRFGTWVEESRARAVAWLVAQALAVGEGYAYLGAEDKIRPFAPLCVDATPNTEG